MSRAVDHTGKIVGRLTVQGPGPRKVYPSGVSYGTWRCRCECGNEIDVLAGAIVTGLTKSCGCLYAETRKGRLTHGKYQTSEYRAWQAMKRRCYAPKDIRYEEYGGRGIAVCDRWMRGDGQRSGSECFLADMGPKPSAMHTLDRVDPDQNYSPENCRWATYSVQNSNRRPYKRGQP